MGQVQAETSLDHCYKDQNRLMDLARPTTKNPAEKRCLTEKEWDYVQHGTDRSWNLVCGLGGGLLAIGVGLSVWAWRIGNEGFYLMGAAALLFFIGGLVLLCVGIPRLLRLRPNRWRPVKKRQVRVFPLPMVWFQPHAGCRVRSELASIPAHWSSYFDYLRPIDGDGSLNIVAQIYETKEENHVLALANGLSVEKEMSAGLLQTFSMSLFRGFIWYFFVFYTTVFGGFVIGVASGILPVAESFSAFLSEAIWLTVGALTFLVALGIPAIYFWRQHKRALARIEAMYEAEGLPERGHERNVGSQIDSPANSNAASSHDDRNAASTKRSTT